MPHRRRFFLWAGSIAMGVAAPGGTSLLGPSGPDGYWPHRRCNTSSMPIAGIPAAAMVLTI